MLFDKEKKINNVSGFTGHDSGLDWEDESKKDYKKVIIFSLSLFIFLVVLGLAFYLYNNYKNKNKPIPVETAKPAEEKPGFLPGDNLDSNSDGNNNGSDADGLQGEKITLGQFYKEPKVDFDIKLNKVSLPLNVKSDVVNYYDISRKINLDSIAGKLDKNGFLVIENQFSKQANDFYSVYSLLSEKNIPILITNDYILYYFQNNLKQIYKRIEKDVFYYSIREASNKLFDIANARYKNRVEKIGLTSDPAIEGQRMYLAYLAVVLKLLSPTPEQIDDKTALNEYYFTPPEAQKFSFDLPSYLNDDVLREVDLIRKAKTIEKSPIFKYQIDYAAFKVPSDYSDKAKLNNFYLASLWIKSAFPLYYKSESCPNCLIDKDDWMISIIASCFMTKDLSDNQDIKNEWAKIYKIISFFSGLRQELTYLNYQTALVDSFGKDYDLEKIFTRQNPDMLNNAIKLQKKLETLNFNKTEGGYGRENDSEKKLAGLRLLQETYLPDNYIFSFLVDPNVSDYLGDYKNLKNTKLTTSCKRDNKLYRCLATSYDLANVFYQIPDENKYFYDNTNYLNYKDQIAKVKKDISLLNVDDWHRNSFWLTMNIGKLLFDGGQEAVNNYYQNNDWKAGAADTMLGALLNQELSFDKYELASQKITGLSSYQEKNKYDYVEPNIFLINELQASANMLNDYLFNLKIMEEAVLLKGDLEKLQANIGVLKDLVTKELKQEELDDRDLQLLNNFLFEYKLASLGKKEQIIYSSSRSAKQIRSINGVKLLISVKKIGLNNVFTVGPVFNYQEY